MKKTRENRPARPASGDMRREYRLDYRKARPNRFADRVDANRLVVVLDPDIAQVFKTPGSVNDVLRALISTMPTPAKPKVFRKRPSPRAA